jgi:UDP-glucose 4-epimerase
MVVHGDGAQTRDFVFVSDVVAHLMQSMRLLQRSGFAKVLNVCTGRGTTVQALAETLLRTSGIARARIEHGDERVGDIRHSVGDPRAATALLGVRAGVLLEDGLRRTLGSLSAIPVPELSR